MQTLRPPTRTLDFERLRTTLLGGQADAVPLLELGIHPKIKAAILGRPLAGVEDEIAFMRAHGYDFVKLQPVYQFEQARQEKRRGTHQRDAAAPDRAWASEHEGVITSWEDFENYEWPRPENVSYANFEKAARTLPDGMGIIGQYGDIFTTTWELMGFENFAMTLCEDPDLVEAVMERVAHVVLSMFETMADIEAVGAMWYSDDIAYTGGLMVSPDFLRERFFPRLARIGAAAKRRGLPLLYHSDGVLWDVLEDIIGAGVTSLHPIEPKAMNIAEVKERAGGRLCVCGNVDVDLLSRGTPDDIVARVRELIRTAAPGGAWCLGSSNSVPDYVRVENFLAMVRTGMAEGTY